MLTSVLRCRYPTLRNGCIALAQAHIASLIIFVSQCVTLLPSILYSWQVANMPNMFTKKQGFSEGSSICSTTLPATPSARLRGAGHIQHQHDERKSMMQGPLLLQIFIVPLKDLLTQFNSCHQCMWNFWMHTMKMRINKSRRQEPIAV